MEKAWSLYQRYDDIRQRTGQAPLCQAATYERAIAASDGMMDFILSTPGIKRDGYDIVQSGWQFDRFLKSGSLALWRHSDKEPTDIMGNWAKVWKSSAAGVPLHLRGRLAWLSEDKNPAVPPVRLMYEDGNIRATSVQWQDCGPRSVEEITAEELAAENANVDLFAQLFGGVRFLQSDLIEGSLVPLGMDPDALSVRCRNDARLARFMPLFVSTVPAPAEHRTKDGAELLFLDGHPARFTTDRPVIVDLGATEALGETAPKRAAIPFSIHGDVPMADRGVTWDGGAARQRLRKWASSDGSGDKDKMDWAKFEEGFVWFDSANKESFGAYKGGHHDIVGGKFESVWHGVTACAQRIQQGAFDVPAGDLGGMKAHIGQEYARFHETPPWDTKNALGCSYGQLHDALRSADEKDVPALRESIVQLATHVYGATRLRESWEPHVLPAGAIEFWEPFGRAVEQVLLDGLGDVEDACLLTERILSEAGRCAAPAMEAMARYLRVKATAEDASDATRQQIVGDVAAGGAIVQPQTYPVGSRVKVRTGQAHDAAQADAMGTVNDVSTPAHAVKFDGMHDPHKWYVAGELMPADAGSTMAGDSCMNGEDLAGGSAAADEEAYERLAALRLRRMRKPLPAAIVPAPAAPTQSLIERLTARAPGTT